MLLYHPMAPVFINYLFDIVLVRYITVFMFQRQSYSCATWCELSCV